MTSAIGLGILTAGHRHGWAVAAGGSQSITDALAALLEDLGGKIETGHPHLHGVATSAADVTMFDMAPGAVASILGDRLPARVARAYRRFRHGPGAFKVDFAVEGGVPWTNPEARRGRDRACRRHLRRNRRHRAGHPRRAHARAAVRARRPAVSGRPRTIRRQRPPGVDATRTSPTGTPATPPRRSSPRSSGSHPDSATGSSGTTVRTTTQMAAYNPNYVGGDIMTGAKDIRQLDLRPANHALSLQDRACPAGTSARRPPHPARARTACAATTPPKPHLPN